MYSPSGVYVINIFVLYDDVGNQRIYYPSDLAALGFPTTFNQVGQGDVEAPQLRSLSWTPSSVNSSTGAQTITVTARITDDMSGANQPQLGFQQANSGGNIPVNWSGRISGTALDGVWQGTVDVPMYSPSGVYVINIFVLYDDVGNQRIYYPSDLAALGFPTTFTNN
jgi:hypothetical protein